MKKAIIVFLILVVWTASSTAEIYNSSFGFSINIPSHWLIVSSQEVKNNPDLFNLNKITDEKTKNMILQGNIEVYYNRNTADSHFVDNIIAFKQVGRLPQTISEINEACKSKGPYKNHRVYECALRKVASLNAFYTEFDGIRQGRRVISYQRKSTGSKKHRKTQGQVYTLYSLLICPANKLLCCRS